MVTLDGALELQRTLGIIRSAPLLCFHGASVRFWHDAPRRECADHKLEQRVPEILEIVCGELREHIERVVDETGLERLSDFLEPHL